MGQQYVLNNQPRNNKYEYYLNLSKEKYKIKKIIDEVYHD